MTASTAPFPPTGSPPRSGDGVSTAFRLGEAPWRKLGLRRRARAERAPGVRCRARDHAARMIRARLAGCTAPRPFRYRHLGSLATIGRKVAVADFGFVRLCGRLAWLLWGLVHIYFLIGFRNRAAVLLDWLWAYVTFQRGSRLITGPTP